MPFRTTDDLYEAVESWLEAPDLQAEIPDFVRLSEIDLGRDLAFRFTNLEFEGTLLETDDSIPLPAGGLYAESLSLETDKGPVTVDLVSARQFNDLERGVLASSTPRFARHRGLTLHLTPAASRDYAYTLWYQSVITSLDDTNTTNWLLDNGFDALLFGACKFGALFRGQKEQAIDFLAEYEKAKQSVKILEFRARTAGGNLRVQTDIQNYPHPTRFGRI